MKTLIWMTACGWLLAATTAGAGDLKQVAKDVRDGTVAVGTTYSMDRTTRYHNVHAKAVGLNCESCHMEVYAPDMLLVGRNKVLSAKHPGPVDRTVCVACHRGGGPGRLLYGPAFSD